MKIKFSITVKDNLKIRQFYLYLLFGGFGALTDFMIFKILIDNLWHPILSNIVSTTIGVALSYLLNSKFNFRQNTEIKTILKFATVAVIGLTGSSLYIKFLIDGFGVSAIAAKITSMPLIAVGQFLGNRTWTFKVVEKKESFTGQ
jgi:putative flippase GtrA